MIYPVYPHIVNKIFFHDNEILYLLPYDIERDMISEQYILHYDPCLVAEKYFLHNDPCLISNSITVEKKVYELIYDYTYEKTIFETTDYQADPDTENPLPNAVVNNKYKITETQTLRR